MSNKTLPDFSAKHRKFKEQFTEPDGVLPNLDLLGILETIVWDALEAIPTGILLDAEKYTLNNFVFDWLGVTSTGRTTDRTKRPFNKRNHGLILDCPAKEITISIKSRDKKVCIECGSFFGKFSSCQCGLCKGD